MGSVYDAAKVQHSDVAGSALRLHQHPTRMNTPSPSRSLSRLLFTALAGCASVPPPAPAVAPPATPSATTEPVASAAAAPAAPTPPRCQVDRDACLREGLPTLLRTLPEVSRSPEQAMATLRTSNSPTTRAWVAYLAHHAGDDAAAGAALTELARDGETPEVDEGTTDPALRALRLIRVHAELLGDDVVQRLPCAVFAWDPAPAARAFGPMHGSGRDELMAPFKRRCVAEAQTARVVAAAEAASRALFRAWPQPSGTIWNAAAIAAQEALREPLLGIEGAPIAEQDAQARALVARLAESPELLRPLAAYRRSVEGQVGAIASGICAASRERGRPLTAGQCERRAYTATLTAFTLWVGPQVDME